MKPLLAQKYTPHKIAFPCHVQPKLNGVRALYQGGKWQSRDEIVWDDSVLAHLTRQLKALRVSDKYVLDGELYVHGWPLQRINAAVTPVRTEPIEDTLVVEYHVFDVAINSMPFADRYALLHELLADQTDAQIVLVPTQAVHSAAEADGLFMDYVARGYEGLMYRLGDCPYTRPKGTSTLYVPFTPRSGYLSDKNNRCWHLQKRKAWQDDEFRCVGVTVGEGKRSGMIGALVCETKRFQRFNVGTGFTDSQALKWFNDPPIDRMVKVKFLTYSSEGIPLNPSLEAIL